MLRKAIWGVLGLGVVAALLLVGRLLYLQDAKGLRTALAKRNPEQYAQQDLSGREFRQAFLPYANFQGAKLRETNFSDANLQFADFQVADFYMASLSHANLSDANLQGAKLDEALFLDSAIFRRADFRDTDLSGVSFYGLFGRMRLSKPKHLLDPSMGGADLTGALFNGGTCLRTNFSRCVLVGASFRGCDCREADFEHADLRNADFTDADLRGAKLAGADLGGANFTNAKRDADLPQGAKRR